MRQMNKFTPTWMEPRVIRSIWDDAALSMASSKLSSFDGGCHTKGKHAQVDPYFATPIRLLPHYITVRKEIRAVSDGNSALQRAKPAKPAKPKSSFYHLERKDWNSASGISFLGSPILPKARQGNLKRRQDLCHAVRSLCVCVRASHPLQSGRFCDWRVQHVARVAMPTVWWGLRRRGCGLCLFSFFSFLKITVQTYLSEDSDCHNWLRWSAVMVCWSDSAGRRRCLRMWWGKSPGWSFNHLTSGRRSSGWNWQFVGFSKLSWSFTGGFWQFWHVLTGPTFQFFGKNIWLRVVFGIWYPGWMFKDS